MSETVIRFRGSRAELMARLRALGPVLAGKESDPTGLVDGLKLRMGTVLLGKIQDDYVRMSEGGTGEMGIQWPPLSLVTLALRRKRASGKDHERTKAAFRNLSATQRQQVRAFYRRTVRFYLGRERREARSALKILERQKRRTERQQRLIGADQVKKRLKDIEAQIRQLRKIMAGQVPVDQARRLAFAAASALMLRDSGRMFNSLSPGIVSSDRVLETEPGAVIVGSNDQKLKYHQSDKPRKLKKDGAPKLPRRQVLPDAQHPIPASWWRSMRDVLASGISVREFWLRLLGPKAA